MEGSDVTDNSLSISTSLSISEFSNDRTQSSHDSSKEDMADETRSSTRKKRIKKKNVELIPPEEKLKKCEKRFITYAEAGEDNDAFSELLKLGPLVRLVYGEQNWRYADACVKLAKGYLDFKGLGSQALKHAESAKSLILSCNTPHTEKEKSSFIKCIVEVYLCLGRSLASVGEKYKDAENCLHKSWEVLKSFKTKTSNNNAILIPSRAADEVINKFRKDIKLALADVFISTKQIDKAVSALNCIIKLIMAEKSENDISLVPIYSNLAKAEKSRKKSAMNYESIVEYNLKAHEIASNCHSLNSKEVADTAFSLARAYSNIDSEQTQTTAETYFNEALNVYRTDPGETSPDALKVEDALARVWMRTDREKEAVKALIKSIPIKAEVFGECSPQVANTHKLIGGVYLSQGNVVNAEKYLNKCLTIETELYGSQHWKVRATKDTLAVVRQNPEFSKSNDAKLQKRPNFNSTIRSKN